MSQIKPNKQILSEKWLAFSLALLVAVMPFSLDTYLPSIPVMAESFSVNIHIIEKTIGLFLFGSALGQLIGGPLSDIKGRRVVSLIGLCIYILASCLIYFCISIEQLMVFRFIQAFGAGMSVVVVGAVVRDIYEGPKAARFFALIGIIMMAAPIAAPVVGAILQAHLGWRSIFLFFTFYGVFLVIVPTFLLKESNPQKQKINIDTFKNVGLQYASILKTKAALGFLFFQAFSFASMFAFITESPFVYMNLYQVLPEDYPIIFGVNIIVMAIFNRVTSRLLRKYQPLDILPAGILIQLIMNISLFIAAIFFSPPLSLVVVLVMFSVGSQGLIVANVVACYMEYFPKNSGTANAVLGTVQFIIASFIAWCTTLLHDGTLQPMAIMMMTSTLVGLTLLCLLSNIHKKAHKE